MAILLLEDGRIESNASAIHGELEPLGIDFRHNDPGTSILFPDLLNQDAIAQSEKNYILELHQHIFASLQQEKGYLWYEFHNIHPGCSRLKMLIDNYSRYHTKNSAEASYVLAGELLYGFINSDGRQLTLLIQSQDYIHIPHGVEHWCSPSALLNAKFIRFFTAVDGWIPNHTGTIIQFPHN